MRHSLAIAGLLVLVSTAGSRAQVVQTPTPPPTVSAASADWQANSEPIAVNGVIYTPTRQTRFFDREIMSQVAVYRSVPVYADVTQEPNSAVYVPVGRLMRRYERGRAAEQPPAEAAGTTGAVATPVMATSVSIAERPAAPTHVESIRRPESVRGVWIERDGVRWYAAGRAVQYSAERFTQVGEYRGFPVYLEKVRGSNEMIWVATAPGGPIAPYRRR